MGEGAVALHGDDYDELMALVVDLRGELAQAGAASALPAEPDAAAVEALVVEEHCVALPTQPDLHVDVRRFFTLQAHVTAHGHAPHHLCDDCLAALTEAASLYADDFLAGFSLKGPAQFDAWQTLTAECLRLELAAALEKLAGTLLAHLRCDQALPHARRCLALDPLHEPSHRLLMQLYALNGDQAAVARQYMHCTQLLATELGIQPSPETVTLYHKLAPKQRIIQMAPIGGASAGVERLGSFEAVSATAD